MKSYGPSQITFLSITGLNLLLTLFSCIIVLLFRNITQSLTARAPILCVIGALGNCFQLIAFCLSYSVVNTPCLVIAIIVNVGLYCTWTPYLLRTWRLYYIYSWNSKDVNRIIRRKDKVLAQINNEQLRVNALSQIELKSITTTTTTPTSPTTITTNNVNNTTTTTTTTPTTTTESVPTPVQQQQQLIQIEDVPDDDDSSSDDEDNNSDGISVGDLEDEYHYSEWTEIVKERLNQMQTNVNKQRASEYNLIRFLLLFGFILLTAIVPWSIVNPNSVPHAEFLCEINKRQLNSPQLYIYKQRLNYPALPLVFHAIISIMMLIAVYMLRYVKDSYYLNVELRLCTCISLFETIILIFTTFTRVSFLFLIFKIITTSTMQIIVIHWPMILAIENYIRMKLFHLRSNHSEQPQQQQQVVVPRDIRGCLRNEQCRDLLRAHLAKALCAENVMFYEEAMEYRLLTDNESRRIRAQQIIEMYLQSNSVREINVSGSIKKRVRQRYERAIAPLNQSMEELDHHPHLTFHYNTTTGQPQQLSQLSQIPQQQQQQSIEIPVDLFNQALDSLEVVMNENGSFASFLRSEEYKKWATHMQNEILRKQIEYAGGL